MPSLFKDGLTTLFTFFAFITLYLVLNNLGYSSVVIWVFLGFNIFAMTISLFLVLQSSEKSVRESGHEARIFWIAALGIFAMVAILLQFIFLFETKAFVPATIGLSATLTTITVAYFLMAKDMYETKAPIQ